MNKGNIIVGLYAYNIDRSWATLMAILYATIASNSEFVLPIIVTARRFSYFVVHLRRPA